MATLVNMPSTTESLPIFKLAHRYLLYDANTVSYIRREFNICGVLIGGLPQAPQQNVFLGLPVELMPEEARVLVEKGEAYIVDDVVSHRSAFLGNGLSEEERKAYHVALRKQGLGAARGAVKRTDDRKKAALKKKLVTEDWNDITEDMLKPPTARAKADTESNADLVSATSTEGVDGDLFAPPDNSVLPQTSRSRASSVTTTGSLEPFAVTPTASYPPLQCSAPSSGKAVILPETPQSYPLFKHLHEKGYFLAPGLRFGCQYMAYPGDPLRFHSHFLCNGMEWDQEFDLLDLVGGGRLGTGVKKGFLVGGLEERKPLTKHHTDDFKVGGARAFCIEWGGM